MKCAGFERLPDAGILPGTQISMQQLLSSVLEESSSLIAVTGVDGCFVYINSAGRSLLKIEGAEELTAVSVLGFLTEDSRELLLSAARQEQGSSFPTGGKVSIVTPDGHRLSGVLTCHRSATGDLSHFSILAGHSLEHGSTEVALRESEARLKRVTDNMLDLVAELDANAAFVYASPSYHSVLGYHDSDLIGRSAFERVHPEDAQRVSDIYAEFVEGRKPGRAEFRYRRSDGEYLWIQTIGNPVYDDEGRHAGCILSSRDLTEQRQSMEALARSEERFHLIAENAADAVYCFELQPSPRITYVSPAVFRMTGFKAEEYYSDPRLVLRVVDRKYRPGLLAAIGGRPIDSMVLSVKHRDGRVVWAELRNNPVYDKEGALVRVEGIARDVTDRVLTEQALRESEENYRVLVEAIDDAISVRDAAGCFVAVNNEFLLRNKTDRSQVIGRTLAELYPEELAAQIHGEDRRVLETGAVVDTEQHFSGRERAETCHVRRAPLRDSAGKVVGTVNVSRDVTERRRLEQQLRRAQRLEGAGKVAGQVAHDFNNLLAPVIAFAELLKNELPEGHAGHRYCEMMLSSAQRMADINQDLLTLGRRGLLVSKLVSLNQIVGQVVGEFTGRPDTVSVETLLGSDLLPVKGSQAQLHRMVVNLVGNAIDAMDGKGVLTLKTESYYVDRPFGRYNRVEMGEYVKLTVSDTGCGIPNQIRDKVFDAFFTTKSSDKRRGSGLGLSVVQAIVDDHRGYLDLSTEPGSGTSFYVYLPVCRDEPKQQPETSVPGGTERVLVVDDDAVQQEVSRHLLGRLGYNVSVVSSGEEAIEYLSQDQADLLILDMIMPHGIDGAETYRRAKQIRPDQKAIVLSGFAESGRVRQAQALGVGACLQKPVRMEVLAQAVRRALDGR